MHFGGLWSSFGFGWIANVGSEVDGRKLKTKEAKNVKNYCTKDKELSHNRVSLQNSHPLPCKPIVFPLDSHAMLNHPCPLQYFWFHASIHSIITLNCCIPLVPFTHQISHNFHNHYMHQLMLHQPPLGSYAVCNTCCCTFDSFLKHFTSLFISIQCAQSFMLPSCNTTPFYPSHFASSLHFSPLDHCTPHTPTCHAFHP